MEIDKRMITQQYDRRRVSLPSQRPLCQKHRRFESVVYLYVLLSIVLVLVLVAGDDSAATGNCPMDIWIFSSFDSCQAGNAPVANGKIYADGQCHTIETDIDSTNPSYALFPGNYRAQCIDSDTIRFSDSACLDNVCTTTTLVSNSTTPPVCDRDNASPASLYSRLVPPEYTVQDATSATVGAFYTCLKLDGSDVTVTFVVFGDCSQSSCAVVQPTTPATNAPVAVAPQGTSAPATAPPVSTIPTAPPVVVVSPTTAPVSLNSTSAPVTVNLTNAPSLRPTVVPVVVVAPVAVPTIAPSKPKPIAPTTPVSNGLVNDVISVAMRLSPMNITIDTTTNSIRNWEDATIEQIESSVIANEYIGTVISSIDIWNITQLVFDPKKSSTTSTSGANRRNNYRSLQQNTTTIVTGTTKTTALQISFDLSMNYTPSGTNTGTLADYFTSSFDSEQERSNYLIKLVTNDDIFSYVRLVEIVYVLDRDGQPFTVAPSSSPIDVTAPTEQQTSNSSESSGSGLLIALAGGGAALIILAVLGIVYFQRQHGNYGKNGRKNSSNNSKENKTNDANDTPSDNDEYYGGAAGPAHLMNNNLQFSPPQQRWTNEIVVDPSADDVSTLGGSVLAGYLDPTTINNNNNQATEEDEPTASVNLDFDYNRNQYRSDVTEDVRSRTIHTETTGTAISNFTSKLGMNGETAVFADDASFEELYADIEDIDIIHNNDKSMKNSASQIEKIASLVKPFEVRAPPGKLGMVVDTPNGGVPVVRAIRDDSVLSDKVLVGDRLISVDHKDVTSMSALDVSSLISIKQHQHRLLVFCRLQQPQQPITPITTVATNTPQTSLSPQPSPMGTAMATAS